MNARRRHESNVFVKSSDVFECLNEIFKNHDRERKARRNFIKFKMKSDQIFSNFYSEFILLTNQLSNAIQKFKIENLRDKIIEELKLVTVNIDKFDSLLNYKNHLQSIYLMLSHIESKSQFFSKAAARIVNRASRIAKTIDVLLRMLFKIKFDIDVEKKILKNLINFFSRSRKC